MLKRVSAFKDYWVGVDVFEVVFLGRKNMKK